MATKEATTTDETPDSGDSRPIPFTDREKATAAASTTDETPVSFKLPSGTKVTATAAVRDAALGKSK